MTEKDFTDKIRRQNLWLAFGAICVVLMAAVGAFGALRIMEDCILPGSWEKIFMVVLFLLLLTAGVTWALRGSQRNDLYTVVTGMSVTQLKRFRGEIDDVVEKLEEDLQKETVREGKIRRIRRSGE